MKNDAMKLQPNQVKQFREQKAWSQSHLAEVSGLSLRTIQRIEKDHSATQESVQALASVFETTTSDLLAFASEPPVVKSNKSLFTATAFAAIIAFVMAYTWSGNSVADDVTLDFSASYRFLTENPNTEETRLLTIDGAIRLAEGEATRLKINEQVSFEISATFLEDNKILILTNIFDETDDPNQIVASPKIITLNHKEAVIEVGDEEIGKVYSIRVTPHK